MSGKTVYISDMDGTLLNADAVLSPYTVEVINQLIMNGMHFTVATARTPASAKMILEPLQPSIPIILMNGALVYDRASDAYVRTAYILPEAVTQALEVLQHLQMEAFLYEHTDDGLNVWHEPLFTAVMRDFKAERVKKYYKTFFETERLSDIAPERVLYLTVIDTQDRIFTLRERLSQVSGLGMAAYRDVYSDEWFLEMYSHGASKKSAALFLKEQYGYTRLVGFGDNLNDLPLFEVCDYKLAMANALPEVCDAADEVIGANTDDGVAKWLDKQK